MSDSRVRRAVRTIVPRAIRNWVRRPIPGLRSAWWDLSFLFGRRDHCRVRPDWEVTCHPESLVSFHAHTRDPVAIAELDGFARHCTPGMILIDVGAHFGVLTLAALHYGGPNSLVWAVEPSAHARRILGANLRLSGAKDRVRVLATAIGDRDGVLPMLTTGPAGHYFLVTAPSGRTDTTAIPMVTLDTLAADLPAPATHLKIDVEGFELEVLAGGRKLLRTSRPVVFLELHGDLLRARGQDPVKVFDELIQAGYRRFELAGESVTPQQAAGHPIARLICLAE